METKGILNNEDLAPRQSSNAITRSSTALTPSRNSENELNAAAVVGQIFDRFRVAQGWKPEQDDEDHERRVAAFLEILGAARIPVKHYDALYRRAMVGRGSRKAEGKEVSYFINPEELLAEWPGLQRDLANKYESVPETCSQPHDAGHPDDRLNVYAVGGVEEIALPCHECRPEAYRKRVAEHLEHCAQKRAARPKLPGEVQINPQQMAAIFSNPHERISMTKSAADILNDCYELVKLEWERTVGEDRKDFLCEIATMLIHAMEYVEKRERRTHLVALG